MTTKLEELLVSKGALVEKDKVLYYDVEFLRLLVAERNDSPYVEDDRAGCTLVFSDKQVERALEKWEQDTQSTVSISKEEQLGRIKNTNKLHAFENVVWLDAQHIKRFTTDFLKYFVEELGSAQVPDMSNDLFNHLIVCSTDKILEKAEEFSNICKEERKEFAKEKSYLRGKSPLSPEAESCDTLNEQLEPSNEESKNTVNKIDEILASEEGLAVGGYFMPSVMSDSNADQAVRLVNTLQELVDSSEHFSGASLSLLHSFGSKELSNVINNHLRKDVNTVEMLKKCVAIINAKSVPLEVLQSAKLVFDKFCQKEISCPPDYEIDGCTKCPLFIVQNLIKNQITQAGGKPC